MTGLDNKDLAPDDSGFEAELALSDEDSLPWLETDEFDDRPAGVDAARIVGFAVVLLALVGVGLGGAWWYANRDGQSEFVADGSTVAAPDGPYKERPADPGGKEFAGTGSVAPVVGEGETREGTLRDDTPAPSIATLPVGEQPVAPVRPSPAPVPSAETPADTGGVSVQVGAYRNRAQAEAGWVTLQRQTTALNGVKRRIVKGEADIGTVYRLQALPGDLAAARALCEALKADGVACQVKR